MKESDYPKLILPEWFNQRLADETPIKGFLSNMEAELSNGNRYILNFIDPIRLNQDLETETKRGRPYLAEQGMVILPEVTVDKAREVLKQLLKDGFFETLKPL